jgi:hypothetical protein
MTKAFPLLRHSIAVVWLVSALLPFTPYTYQQSLVALQQLGATGMMATLLLALGIVTDLLCAYCAAFINRPWAWRLQAGIVIAYTVLLSISQPLLWLDPFGPLLKNIPFIALCLFLSQTPDLKNHAQ